jgi:hypothetical protein
MDNSPNYYYSGLANMNLRLKDKKEVKKLGLIH